MTPFEYTTAHNAAEAVRLAASRSDAKFLAGGTNLVDLMRETIETPRFLIDVRGLSDEIAAVEGGGVRIGAAARNTDVAAHPLIRERFPMLSRALLAGASGQIRNMATVGGNIMQRTRCHYFYDDTASCNKRIPGTGCDAIHGFSRMHAILGASQACVATHPSDMCVALAALDAVVHLESSKGSRKLNFTDFHRLPEETPHIETALSPGELITAVELPPCPFAAESTYRKIRDRASYAFALVSVAAALDVDNHGRVRDIRLALGGVAHKPWRAWKAEKIARGAPADPEHFQAAAEAELAEARGLRDNGFKIELTKRAIVACLNDLNTGTHHTGALS